MPRGQATEESLDLGYKPAEPRMHLTFVATKRYVAFLKVPSPVRGIAHRVVYEVAWNVVWSFVGKAISGIVCRTVSGVTTRSPWSVVWQAIRSAAVQAATPVMYRSIRDAIRGVARHAAEEAIPLAVCDTTRHIIPHVADGIVSPILSGTSHLRLGALTFRPVRVEFATNVNRYSPLGLNPITATHQEAGR